MITSESIWKKLGRKKYREEFVASQVKIFLPLQIRKLLEQHGISQSALAERAGLTQGVVSRAANPEYGNLTLNTLLRIAAGFDVAFVGKFVPFTELDRWFADFSEKSLRVKTFVEESQEIEKAAKLKGQRVTARIERAYSSNLQGPTQSFGEINGIHLVQRKPKQQIETAIKASIAPAIQASEKLSA